MTASASPVVQLSGVRIDRGGRTILRDVSLDVPRGSITAVLGPSGSGKSTLLAALTGELRPVAGTVTLFGSAIPHGNRALLEMRRNVGVLLQGNGLLTDLSVADNVALPLRTHTRLPAPVVQRLVQMKLHAVGLLAAADAWPRELSGGMARRVALARALALDPPLMIYDEPLTGLDPIASGVIMSLIQRLNDSLGLTSIIVSHHVHETLPISDQAVVIANGGIVFAGTPEQLQDSTDRWCSSSCMASRMARSPSMRRRGATGVLPDGHGRLDPRLRPCRAILADRAARLGAHARLHRRAGARDL
ncbi:hypothetical protein XPN_4667 [Xanthomonas arboricola pv. pruni MAFF 301427]|nr:hypothetical protein XPN_4667 [Xanthomonas arboricola pv. pruni MAFF 301427]